MGRPRGWAATQTDGAPMPSPGRPGVNQRRTKQEFWKRIAEGMSSEDAAVACGVSPPVGTRWFRDAGGMPSIGLALPLGRYLSFAEREEIAVLKVQRRGVREIARRPGRSPSTISRELRRNAATRGGKLGYRATVAQWKAERVARPRTTGAPVHARPPSRRGHAPGRDSSSRSASPLGRSSPRSPPGPALGDRLEPGADRSPAAAGLP
jgi:transposase, IS30 family